MGLEAMHRRNILHRDIKSENILCTSDGKIVIADFGESVSLTKENSYRKTRTGTNAWISPEILEGKINSKEIDVWSFGCFAFELTKGEPPLMALANDVGNFIEEITQQEVVERIPDRYSDEFADFVAMAMQKDKLDRWTM